MYPIFRIFLIPLLFVLHTSNVEANVAGKNGLHPRLVSLLWQIERHFQSSIEVISGCRSRTHNRRIGGARESWHLRCMAADVKVKGVNKRQVARYAASLPGRGGIGTYCHDSNVHIDLGPRREWYWGCKGQRSFNQAGIHRTSFRVRRRR
jgi:uncharacterized protein YcbK (DUF882 family)